MLITILAKKDREAKNQESGSWPVVFLDSLIGVLLDSLLGVLPDSQPGVLPNRLPDVLPDNPLMCSS